MVFHWEKSGEAESWLEAFSREKLSNLLYGVRIAQLSTAQNYLTERFQGILESFSSSTVHHKRVLFFAENIYFVTEKWIDKLILFVCLKRPLGKSKRFRSYIECSQVMKIENT